MKSLINTIGIIGSGQMGRGIAQVAAQSGFSVKLFDIDEAKLKDAITFISSLLDKGIAKGKWDSEAKLKTLAAIKTTANMTEVAQSDLIIEAATENKQIKFQIFKDLDRLAPAQTILASNTSSISITEIAAQTNRPHLVAGMHFMNPVPVMKLVEGIKGLITSDETFSQIKAVTEKMSKVFIAANDRPGFAVNRILMPMINEAVFALYENVASAKDIDDAMKLGTNQPMGPLELADFIGLDTCLAIMEVLFEGFGEDKYRPCPLLKQYVTAKRLGKKVGQGFYQY